MLDDRGHFRNDSFAPTYFMGDGHKRVYRYLDNRVDPMGALSRKRGGRMTRVELPERVEIERLILRNRTVADAEAIFDFCQSSRSLLPCRIPTC